MASIAKEIVLVTGGTYLQPGSDMICSDCYSK
jgi:hypothetical protein